MTRQSYCYVWNTELQSNSRISLMIITVNTFGFPVSLESLTNWTRWDSGGSSVSSCRRLSVGPTDRQHFAINTSLRNYPSPPFPSLCSISILYLFRLSTSLVEKFFVPLIDIETFCVALSVDQNAFRLLLRRKRLAFLLRQTLLPFQVVE